MPCTASKRRWRCRPRPCGSWWPTVDRQTRSWGAPSKAVEAQPQTAADRLRQMVATGAHDRLDDCFGCPANPLLFSDLPCECRENGLGIDLNVHRVREVT